jgi:hypothetical protein
LFKALLLLNVVSDFFVAIIDWVEDVDVQCTGLNVVSLESKGL